MKSYNIQRNKRVRGPSGGWKDNWVDAGTLSIAVYQKDDRAVYSGELYKESTHTGLTYGRNLSVRDYRLSRDGVTYQVISCNPQGRLTQLLLKVMQDG